MSSVDTTAQSNGLTVSHFLGEMTWLLSQSPLHADLRIKDLEWLIMPPLALEQFYLFRDGGKPVGLALWARCGTESVKKIKNASSPGFPKLDFEDWSSGSETWLIDLICPFATSENRQRELMIADLIVKPLADIDLHMHHVAEDGERRVVVIDAATRGRLLSALEKAVVAETGVSSGSAA